MIHVNHLRMESEAGINPSGRNNVAKSNPSVRNTEGYPKVYHRVPEMMLEPEGRLHFLEDRNTAAKPFNDSPGRLTTLRELMFESTMVPL